MAMGILLKKKAGWKKLRTDCNVEKSVKQYLPEDKDYKVVFLIVMIEKAGNYILQFVKQYRM